MFNIQCNVFSIKYWCYYKISKVVWKWKCEHTALEENEVWKTKECTLLIAQFIWNEVYFSVYSLFFLITSILQNNNKTLKLSIVILQDGKLLAFDWEFGGSWCRLQYIHVIRTTWITSKSKYNGLFWTSNVLNSWIRLDTCEMQHLKQALTYYYAPGFSFSAGDQWFSPPVNGSKAGNWKSPCC